MSLNHEVIKESFSVAGANQNLRGAGSRNVVKKLIINDATYYAKQITSFLDPSEYGSAGMLCLEDGLTQVYIHTFLRTVMGPPQPFSYLYNANDTYWLIVEEVPHNPATDTFAAQFENTFNKIRTLNDLLTYIPQKMVEGIDKEEEDIEYNMLAQKIHSLKQLFPNIDLNTATIWEDLKNSNEMELQTVLKTLKDSMRDSMVTMPTESQKESFVDLLILMRLLDEDDFSIKNIVTSNNRTVFYDVDLTLSLLNNTVKRMNNRHQSHLEGQLEFTALGLIHPHNLKAKFWLDSMENYNPVSVSIFDDLFDDEYVLGRLRMLNQRFKDRFLGSIVENAFDHLHLDEELKGQMNSYILQHFNYISRCIADRCEQMLLAEQVLKGENLESLNEDQIPQFREENYRTQTQHEDVTYANGFVIAINRMILLYQELEKRIPNFGKEHSLLKAKLEEITSNIGLFILNVRDANGNMSSSKLGQQIQAIQTLNRQEYRSSVFKSHQNPFYNQIDNVVNEMMKALQNTSLNQRLPQQDWHLQKRLEIIFSNQDELLQQLSSTQRTFPLQ